MARMMFGGATAEVFLYEDEDGDLHAGGGQVAKLYEAQDESAGEVTDLLTESLDPATQIVLDNSGDSTGAGQLPIFWGPDGIYELWVSVNGSPRQLLTPHNVGSDLASMKSTIDGFLNSGVTNPTGMALGDLLGVDNSVWDADEGTTLVKQQDGEYGAGGAAIPLTDTLWVAAGNAPASFDPAPYHCDGVDDNVEINAALNNTLGLRVGLSPGTFNLSSAIAMRNVTDPAGVKRAKYLYGAGQSVTILNVQSGASAGILLQDNVTPHISDMTINVLTVRAIWAYRPSGSPNGYLSALNGTIRRITVNGPADGTNTNWAISLKSADRMTVEQVTTSNTKYGIEFIAESSEQVIGGSSFTQCTVNLLGDGGQAFKLGMDVGVVRDITYLNCTANVAPTTSSTTGWRLVVQNAGQIYGVRAIGIVAKGIMYPWWSDAGAHSMDVDFARIEARQGSLTINVYGHNNKVNMAELVVPVGVTSIQPYNEQNNLPAYPNQYSHHIYFEGSGVTLIGSVGGAILTKGVVEGTGTIPASLLRAPSKLIDRKDLVTSSTSSLGTIAANFTLLSSLARVGMNGKLIMVKLSVRNTNALTVTSANITDVTCFTVATPYRPSQGVQGLLVHFNTSAVTSGHGAAWLNTDGTVQLITSISTITAASQINIQFPVFAID